METVKEFFKHINYRLSSPFIFSFVIAWLFWNWQVPISILFRDKEFLRIDGYKSYIDLISKTVTTWTGIIYPALSAIAYTLINPFISSIVHALYTWVQKNSDAWDLKIWGGAKISFDKYITLKKNIEAREEILQQALDEEKKIVSQVESLTTQNFALQQELNRVRAESTKDLADLRATFPDTSYSTIQGKWEVKLSFKDGQSRFEQIVIRGNSFYILQNGREIRVAMIQHYAYNRQSKQIFFLKVFEDEFLQKNPNQAKIVVAELLYNESSGNLSGTENATVQTYYRSME